MPGRFEKIETKKEPRLPKFILPAWLFVVLMAVFQEWILHFWTMDGFDFGRLISITLFALGLGGILGLFTSLFPNPKAQKGIALGIAVVLVVLYMTEYFLQDAYRNFMTIDTIVGNAGGVATDYTKLIISLLTRNLWRILLVLLPVVLYGVFCRSTETNWTLRGILAASAVVMHLLGIAVVNVFTGDAAVMKTAYNFDGAVRSFGLHVALVLDATHSASTEEAPEFVAAPEQPVMPTQPTEPQEEEQDVEATEPIVYGDNVLEGVDFNALAETVNHTKAAALHQYVASLTPSQKNEYTGLFAGKNLIFITAEALTAEVIDPELTPTLYRLANNGIKFTDYYQPAWGASTTTGEFSNLIGIVPTTGGSCMWEPVRQDFFLTIGKQLQKLGYHSAAYHNHLHDFYDRHQTHIHLGYDEFIARGSGLEGLSSVWPESDLEMMEITVADYIDKQPFSIYYMTVSGHSVYNTSANAMAEKNYEVVKDLPYSEAVKCYLACQLELEYAMESLLRQLEEAGILDDTVIVMGTDHYPYGLEDSSTWQNYNDCLSELYGYKNDSSFTQDHNALIIWSGCIEGMGLQVDTPVYSLDILPTISNLFGVEYDSRLLVGRDVFSDQQPLVLWPNYSWKTDLGSYNFRTREFTPAEGVTVDEAYVDYIHSLVQNKITYSRTVQEIDYFRYLSDQLAELEGTQ